MTARARCFKGRHFEWIMSTNGLCPTNGLCHTWKDSLCKSLSTSHVHAENFHTHKKTKKRRRLCTKNSLFFLQCLADNFFVAKISAGRRRIILKHNTLQNFFYFCKALSRFLSAEALAQQELFLSLPRCLSVCLCFSLSLSLSLTYSLSLVFAVSLSLARSLSLSLSRSRSQCGVAGALSLSHTHTR